MIVRTRASIALIAAALVLVPASAKAQLMITDSPIVYGHHHVNASDVAAHKRFWVDALGGASIKAGTSNAEIVKFPNVLVFLASRAPSGGSKGTTVNHVGFETQDIRAAVARLKAHGFPMITRNELPADYEVTDDLGQRPGGNIVAFVMGPDDTKVELIENRSARYPIGLHHVHFAANDGAAVQAWYVKTFGATAGTRINQPAADLPGINLTFAPAAETLAPTRGRAIDHIGFEVRNLEAFCRQLQASGITLDRPYSPVPALGIAVAFLTDPWGTYIELTEGLTAIQ